MLKKLRRAHWLLAVAALAALVTILVLLGTILFGYLVYTTLPAGA